MRFLLIFSIGLTLSCVSTRPNYQVFPLADGTFEVEAVNADKQQAARDAADGVVAFCKSEAKTPVFLARPEPVYQGPFDETIMEGVRSAGRVAKGVGALDGDADWDDSLSEKNDYKATYKATCR